VPAVVGSFIVHEPAASATDNATMPDVVPLRLTIPVEEDAVPTVILVPKVGAVENTSDPDPVSSVIADARFADDGVAKNVATPVPRPLTPVLIGSPVAFVRVPDDGVPSAPPLTTKAPADPTLTPRAVATPVPKDVIPVPPLATGNVPVTPVVSGKPVALVRVTDVGVPNIGVTSVGLVERTTDPVPVLVVTPVPPLATGNVPVTPVVRGRPVTLVSVPLEGVPRTPSCTTIAPEEPTFFERAVATPVPRPEILPVG